MRNMRKRRAVITQKAIPRGVKNQRGKGDRRGWMSMGGCQGS